MKKLIFVYVLLIFAVALLAIMRSGGNLPSIFNFGPKAEAEVNGKRINLLVAKSDKDRIKGLSGRSNLPQNQGIVFVFERKERYPFWMKGMNFAIDIIYIDDSTVVDLFENVPPAKKGENIIIYKPERNANYVLEINSGKAKELGIKKSTKVTFKGI